MTYRVTFLPMNVTVTVESEQFPLGGRGRPGSLLDVALAGQVGLTHECGGGCACATCHVVVRGGWENLSQTREDEEDRLDMVFGLTARSRLACQAVVRGDVVVEIPSS
jgi:ferredoxin, 2Fe-2S